MNFSMIKFINLACHLVCIIIVIIYAYKNIFNYCQNEDLCEVSYKSFHDDPRAIYPSLTVCFMTPFHQNILSPNSGNEQPFSLNLQWALSWISKTKENQILIGVDTGMFCPL